MITVTPRDTTASVADASAELTDGYQLVVDALRVNGVRTVYGLVGIPMWLAPHSRRACAISTFGTTVMQGMLRRLPGS